MFSFRSHDDRFPLFVLRVRIVIAPYAIVVHGLSFSV
jgi:hypothetical protein